jgi:hypothetical protein
MGARVTVGHRDHLYRANVAAPLCDQCYVERFGHLIEPWMRSPKRQMMPCHDCGNDCADGLWFDPANAKHPKGFYKAVAPRPIEAKIQETLRECAEVQRAELARRTHFRRNRATASKRDDK